MNKDTMGQPKPGNDTAADAQGPAVPEAEHATPAVPGEVDILVLPERAPNADPTSTGTLATITAVVPADTNGSAEAAGLAGAAGASSSHESLDGAEPGWQPSGAVVPATTAVPTKPTVAPATPAAELPAQPFEPSGGESELGRSARRSRENGPEPAASLTSDRLLAKVIVVPVGGWRRWLYNASFGAINVGDSDKVRLARARENSVATRLGDRTRYVPVLSRKGGVGKTTVTTLLGMVLADMREDRVIALDANPDRGTLSDRSPGRADFTARNLVKDRFSVTTFSQLSSYVARDGSRLDVLASDTDPAVAQAFDDADYRAVTDILSKYYSIVLTDSGTGMVHSVMKGTLEKADAVVLVSGGSVDEARLASETLSWLEAHGRHDLVARAIVAINMSSGETQVDIDAIEEHFRSRVNHVLRIPYDKHLAEGSRVELDKLRPATRAAAIELAALVVRQLQTS